MMAETSKALISKTLRSSSPYVSKVGNSKTFDLGSGCKKVLSYNITFEIRAIINKVDLLHVKVKLVNLETTVYEF